MASWDLAAAKRGRGEQRREPPGRREDDDGNTENSGALSSGNRQAPPPERRLGLKSRQPPVAAAPMGPGSRPSCPRADAVGLAVGSMASTGGGQGRQDALRWR